MRKPSHTRMSESQWQAVLSDFQQSGLTQKQYCKKNCIAHSTFSKWKAQLAMPVSQNKDFIELHPESTVVSSSNGSRIPPRLEFAITWLNKLELTLKVR